MSEHDESAGRRDRPDWPELPPVDDPAIRDDAVRGILERLDAVRTGEAEDPAALYADLHAALTAALDAPEGPRPSAP